MVVQEHASLLWELTCHTGSQCYLLIPTFTPAN